jgi:DNA-directed RNA polymerase subunit omega
MIEGLKDSSIMDKVGGKFKLTALIQKRMLELMQGSRPLIANIEGKTNMEIVVAEILQDKIAPDYDSGTTSKAAASKKLL